MAELTQVGEEDARGSEPLRERLRNESTTHDEEPADADQTGQSVCNS
jgi:hypothetical protein